MLTIINLSCTLNLNLHFTLNLCIKRTIYLVLLLYLTETVHINNISEDMPALARNAFFLYFVTFCVLCSYLGLGF